MGFPRFSPLLVCAFLACLFCLLPAATPARAANAPSFSGALNLGGATADPDHLSVSSGANTCPMVQLQVRANHLIGPFNLTGEVRYAFTTADKGELYSKSRYCVGLECPLNPGVVLFANYERYFRQNDDWAFAGISFRFGSS